MIRIATMSLAALALGATAWMIPNEYAALFDGDLSFDALVSRTNADQPAFAAAASYASTLPQLQSCITAQSNLTAMLYPPDLRTNVAEACLDRSDEILSDAPTSALAHTAKGISLAVLQRTDEAATELGLARDLAPREGWIQNARLIALFALNIGGVNLLDEDAKRDAQAMLRADGYYEQLARLYISYPGQRDWLTSALEGQDGNDQKRFLTAVRNIEQGQ